MKNTRSFAESTDREKESSIIKVIGIGDGGCVVVDKIYRSGCRFCDFRICHSDADSLHEYEVPEKYQLHSEKIVPKIFGKRTLMVFLVAFREHNAINELTVIGRIAKKQGFLTVALVAGLFNEEEMRDKSIKGLREDLDAIFFYRHTKLEVPIKDSVSIGPVRETYDAMEITIRGIIEMIKYPSLLSCFDYADVRNALQDSGMVTLAVGEGEGSSRIEQALSQAFNCETLKEFDCSTANRVLINITLLGDSDIDLSEINEIYRAVEYRVADKRKIKGNLISHKAPELGDRIRIILFYIGVKMKKTPIQ